MQLIMICTKRVCLFFKRDVSRLSNVSQFSQEILKAGLLKSLLNLFFN